MQETKLNVKLLRATVEPEIAAATAARLCYSGADLEQLQEKMDAEASAKLIDKIVKLGHYSVLEHANFTFAIEGVSRALSHQLVRHRIASFSQQSQRYVDAKNFGYVIPPKIAANPEAKEKFEKLMERTMETYKELLEISPKEDARYVLPNATDTKVIVTMNTRSLYNFFEKRCCARAQWEIQALAMEMLKQAKEAAPKLFEKAGEPCVSKKECPEGEMSCGKWKALGATLKKFD